MSRQFYAPYVSNLSQQLCMVNTSEFSNYNVNDLTNAIYDMHYKGRKFMDNPELGEVISSNITKVVDIFDSILNTLKGSSPEVLLIEPKAYTDAVWEIKLALNQLINDIKTHPERFNFPERSKSGMYLRLNEVAAKAEHSYDDMRKCRPDITYFVEKLQECAIISNDDRLSDYEKKESLSEIYQEMNQTLRCSSYYGIPEYMQEKMFESLHLVKDTIDNISEDIEKSKELGKSCPNYEIT